MSQDNVQFDPRVVRQLAKILNETDLNEIEYESQGSRIKVVRSRPDVHVAAPAMAHPAAPLAPVAPVGLAPAEKDPTQHPGAVRSPMVGVAYMAPEPGANPFVQVGDIVTKGSTLCIIEAMKVMNPIRAPKEGKVVEILAQNASPVEFDEVLFVIE